MKETQVAKPDKKKHKDKRVEEVKQTESVATEGEKHKKEKKKKWSIEGEAKGEDGVAAENEKPKTKHRKESKEPSA